jgi:hypothetical protein
MLPSQSSGDLSPRPVRILSVPAARPVLVAFLGPYRGLLTHWSAKRSLACPGANLCPPATHRQKVVWKGYAPVDEWSFQLELWLPGVLEITESLEHALAGRKLRGQVWMLSRLQSSERGPVCATYSETLDEAELRPAFSIQPILERFYHSADLLLDVPNPIPPRVLLEPHESRAPRLAGDLSARPSEAQPIDPQTMARFREQLRGIGGNGKGGGK